MWLILEIWWQRFYCNYASGSLWYGSITAATNHNKLHCFLLQPSSSMNGSVRLSVCLSHLFHYVPIIVSSSNFQELLQLTRVMSMQKIKVRGQRLKSQRSKHILSQFWCFRTNSSSNSHMTTKWCSKFVFQGHPSNFISRPHGTKSLRFWPELFPGCNSSLNSQMAMKWCTQLQVA